MEHLLDILAQFGGGRGDQGNEVVRFLLASFFWIILSVIAFKHSKRNGESRDRIITIAAAIGFVSEMMMFVVHLVEWKWYKYHDLLHLYYPPIEHAVVIFVSILIGYAFLKYYAKCGRLPVSYLASGVVVSVLLYLVTAPTWNAYLTQNPEVRFGMFWGDMAFRIFGSIFKGVVIIAFIYLSSQKTDVPKTLLLAFLFFFLDDFLMIFNLAAGDIYKDIYNPIRHNLHIWAIPLFLAVYWRDLNIRTKQDEEKLSRMNSCFLRFGADVNHNLQLLTSLSRDILSASCACYSRLNNEPICSFDAQGDIPFEEFKKAKRQMCAYMIENAGNDVIVHTLQNADNSDPYKFMKRLNMKTLMGMSVQAGKKPLGALCVSYGANYVPSSTDTRILGILASAIGIEEERRIIQERLEKTNRQLRRLSSYLQSIREREREEISREIHDELGQLLTAINLDLYSLKKGIDEDQSGLHERISSINLTLHNAIRSVQRITASLRPTILDNLGLTAALEWQAKEFEKRTGIASNVYIDMIDDEASKEVNTAIFRIYQESLTNVARHSDASRVDLWLKKTDGKIYMEIKDNGKGIKKEQINDHSSFGLMGMRERAFALGGDIAIDGSEGEGTVVKVNIPLS